LLHLLLGQMTCSQASGPDETQSALSLAGCSARLASQIVFWLKQAQLNSAMRSATIGYYVLPHVFPGMDDGELWKVRCAAAAIALTIRFTHHSVHICQIQGMGLRRPPAATLRWNACCSELDSPAMPHLHVMRSLLAFC